VVLLFLHILRTREAGVHRWLDMIVFLLVDAEYVARWSVVSIVRVKSSSVASSWDTRLSCSTGAVADADAVYSSSNYSMNSASWIIAFSILQGAFSGSVDLEKIILITK
jgi:hypothetical protein